MYEQLTAHEIVDLLIRFGIESILVTACLVFAWLRLGLRQVCLRLGKWQSRVMLGFLMLLTMTQLVDRWQYHFPSRISFYPLARFAMYQTGQAKGSVTSYRFEGSFDHGNADFREINITREFSAIGLPPINTRFRVISQSLISDVPAKVEWSERQIAGYCRGIVSLRRRRNAPVPVRIRFVVESWDPQTTTRRDVRYFEIHTDAT